MRIPPSALCAIAAVGAQMTSNPAKSRMIRFMPILHSLRGEPHVIDIRNYGLMGAVELQPLDGQPGARGMQVLQATFDANLMIRITGDTIAFSPPLIIEQQHISQCVDILRQVLRAL
jgi:beta-alanine--pyruvate transaminase